MSDRFNLATGNLITKQALATSMQVGYSTVYKYHSVAMLLEDFKSDYPSLNGELYTRCGLTVYQCWVITKIIREFSNYPEKLVYQIVNQKPDNFSKAAFLEFQAASSSEVVDGELVKI